MAEIALITSLLSVLGSTFPSFLQKLSEMGIIIHQGATVFHKSCEIEFRFHFNKGPIESKLSTIIKSLQKYLVKPLEFDDVIEIHGAGLANKENLLELGIIQVQGDKASVDFGRILNELDSNLVILTVRKKLNPEIPKYLLSVHIDKNPEHEGALTSANIEVALDYANLWYKDFDQFNVRDIEFSFDLGIELLSIIDEMSLSQRRKIINAGKALSKGSKDAITYMKIFSENFLKFESEDLLPDLMNSVSLEPSTNFKIKNIIPKMQSAEIASVSHSVILPGSMKIFLGCRLEGKDIVLKGKITIDLEKFHKVLRKIMNAIETESSELNFKK